MTDTQVRKLFKKLAKENMVYYNDKLFKSTHSSLYKTVNLAIKEAYKQGQESVK